MVFLNFHLRCFTPMVEVGVQFSLSGKFFFLNTGLNFFFGLLICVIVCTQKGSQGHNSYTMVQWTLQKPQANKDVNASRCMNRLPASEPDLISRIDCSMHFMNGTNEFNVTDTAVNLSLFHFSLAFITIEHLWEFSFTFIFTSCLSHYLRVSSFWMEFLKIHFFNFVKINQISFC